MVSLEVVRASNASLNTLGSGLVAVFVGGTSGIGETTAREFVRNTISPKVYLVGRNKEQASRIKTELTALNPDGEIKFIQSDISLLENVDKACAEIQAAEEKLNLLFMTAGYLTLAGRNETSEGLDKKLNLNYYSRFRFTYNLLPLLTAAAKSGSLSRSISVLSAGHEGSLNLQDLSLKKSYTVRNCGSHAMTMNSLSALHLATLHPGTSFIHTYPGAVKTNILQGLGVPSLLLKFLRFASTPFTVPIKESGERHLYAATNAAFGPKERGGDGIGADGLKGSGAYLLHWNGEPTGNKNLIMKYREQGVAEKVWRHTMDVFETVCNEKKKW